MKYLNIPIGIISFSHFLIGYVENYLKNTNDFVEVKFGLLFLLYDLLKEKKIQSLLVDKNNLQEVKWNDNHELLEVLTKLKSEWDRIGKREV